MSFEMPTMLERLQPCCVEKIALLMSNIFLRDRPVGSAVHQCLFSLIRKYIVIVAMDVVVGMPIILQML